MTSDAESGDQKGARSVHRPAWEDPTPAPRASRPVVRQLLMVKYDTEVGATIPTKVFLWRRVVSMAFLPARGDLVAMWPACGEVDEYEWPVHLRRFASDGTAEIELATLSVDPPAPIAPAFQRDFTELPWCTEEEGVADLGAALVRGGWVRQ